MLTEPEQLRLQRTLAVMWAACGVGIVILSWPPGAALAGGRDGGRELSLDNQA